MCSDTTMILKLTKQSDVRTPPPPPPPPFPSEQIMYPLWYNWYTISIIFIWTYQTLFNQMNSSVLSRILFTFWSHIFQGAAMITATARQTPPDTTPTLFSRVGRLSPGKGISEIAATTDPVGKPKLLSLF